MKKFLILFLFFINFFNIFGKEIIKYEGKKIDISKKVFIFEDNTKNVREEDIIRGLYDKSFKLNKDNILYLWNTNAIYYLRLEVQNLTSRSQLDLYGWIGALTLERTDISHIYLERETVVKRRFPRKVRKRDSQELLNYGALSFNISPNEIKTIYLKVKPLVETPLILTERENIIKEERAYLLVTYTLIGISSIILFIILSFYLRLKKSYLLYYILISIFTYLKSNLFLKFLRNYVEINFSFKIYALSMIFYILFLVNFVIDILKLDKGIEKVKVKSYLNFLKYFSLILSVGFLFNLISYSYFVQTRGYIYLTTFTLILYAALKRYKDGWLYKAFFFSWLPQWLLYIYLNIIYQFRLKMMFFDIRIIEYLEVFANLFSIAAVVLYDAKEL